jgi:phosphoribosyl 1,2-cyclic phosphate phosphodiesterase
MNLIFLGTGGAWGLPELNCDCLICTGMRARKESRKRCALLLAGDTNLLIDCGPDIGSQLSAQSVGRIDGVLISHEHGDHYLGMDDLSAYKRTRPRGEFAPIPVFLTARSWEPIGSRFGYLADTGVIETHVVEPGKRYGFGRLDFIPFKTSHGSFAEGSVGYIILLHKENGEEVRLVYTSDFVDVVDAPEELLSPHFLIIQSYWFHEPVKNRPSHMSFQRSLDFIRRWKPLKETFLVHLGDADMVPGDPANSMMKKTTPRQPLTPPSGGDPYPVPLHHDQWQETVNRVVRDYGMPFKITVAKDGMKVKL